MSLCWYVTLDSRTARLLFFFLSQIIYSLHIFILIFSDRDDDEIWSGYVSFIFFIYSPGSRVNQSNCKKNKKQIWHVFLFIFCFLDPANQPLHLTCFRIEDDLMISNPQRDNISNTIPDAFTGFSLWGWIHYKVTQEWRSSCCSSQPVLFFFFFSWILPLVVWVARSRLGKPFPSSELGGWMHLLHVRWQRDASPANVSHNLLTDKRASPQIYTGKNTYSEPDVWP